MSFPEFDTTDNNNYAKSDNFFDHEEIQVESMDNKPSNSAMNYFQPQEQFGISNDWSNNISTSYKNTDGFEPMVKIVLKI
jgi:hypothetical protein